MFSKTYLYIFNIRIQIIYLIFRKFDNLFSVKLIKNIINVLDIKYDF